MPNCKCQQNNLYAFFSFLFFFFWLFSMGSFDPPSSYLPLHLLFLINTHIDPTNILPPITTHKQRKKEEEEYLRLGRSKMEVMVSNPTFDFASSDAKTSPFKEYYLSAPSSPSRVSEFYNEFDHISAVYGGDSPSWSSSIQKTTNKCENDDEGDDDGFSFCVSEESEAWSLSAEELFDGGKIKPLKPHQSTNLKTPLLSDALSTKKNNDTEQRRGRDRTPAGLSSSNSGRRATRSHSPYRVSPYTWDEQHQTNKEESSSSLTSNPAASQSSSSLSSSKSSRKWRLRDFLLFRSASEGRGSNKDPLRKYSVLYKKPDQVKDSSFKPTDSPTGTRRRGPISPHELHYAMKKAESEDLKKRTYLPYKHGILGGSFTR